MKQNTAKKTGFTLIEVVLVLAIGALIILMAVVAFQGSQRARRNTARAALVHTIRAAIEQYAADNRSTYPPTAYFPTMVTNAGWVDPNKATGTIAAAAGTSSNISATGIQYSFGSICSGVNITAGTGFAIQYQQESGVVACVDSTK